MIHQLKLPRRPVEAAVALGQESEFVRSLPETEPAIAAHLAGVQLRVAVALVVALEVVFVAVAFASVAAPAEGLAEHLTDKSDRSVASETRIVSSFCGKCDCKGASWSMQPPFLRDK